MAIRHSKPPTAATRDSTPAAAPGTGGAPGERATQFVQVPFVPRIRQRRWFKRSVRGEFTQSLLVLAQSIRQTARERRLSTILVASASAGDGRTTVAANLALALAATPAWVALVDADGRATGLSALFNAQQATPSATQPAPSGFRSVGVDDMPGLTLVLPEAPLNAQTSLEQIRPLLTSLDPFVEFVVIDSPPCLRSATGFLLSNCVDAVLYVVRRRQQDVDAQRRIQQQFRQLGAYELGVIFNDA